VISPLRILYVDDSILDRELVRDVLLKEKPGEYLLTETASREEFEAKLTYGKYDLVLSDFNILGFEGLQVLERVKQLDATLPVIIVTGTGDEEVAVEAMKRGAADYVIKSPSHILRLPQTIRAVLEKQTMEMERKQAENTLAELHALMNAIIDSTPDMIWSVDPENFGLIMFNYGLSDYFLQRSGIRIQIGMRPEDLFPPGDFVKRWHEFYQRALREGLYTAEYLVDAGTNMLELTFNLLKRDGKVFGISVFGKDITERKRADEQLAVSESELRGLFAAMTDIVMVIDRDGRYLKIAPTNPANFYRTTEDMLGKTAHEILPKEQADYIVSKIHESIQSNQVVNGEYVLQIGGKEVWFLFNASPLSENTVTWVAHDITERKQAEERIRRQLKQLTTLSAIDSIISSNFDIKFSLSEILAHVTIELGIDAADILILNSNSQMLEYAAECGFRGKAIRKVQLRLGKSYAGRATLERHLIQIPNLRNEPESSLMTNLLTGEDFVCYFGVPLIVKGQVNGVMEVFHRAILEPDAEWFDFLFALAGQAAIAIENATLFESLQRSNLELSSAYDATIEGWSHALDLRDKETEGHTQRVTEMTVILGRTFGLSEAELVQVRWGALLHDIGKLGVPDGILLKSGPLTDEEWVAMKKHPTFAYEMLLPIRYLRQALDIPYCHHEKWDGTGYPRGLKGEQIPLLARLFAVVDVWDALISDRPYRQSWSKEKAREYIIELSGKHFDPQAVQAFLEILGWGLK
jgi:PAS domain S-box-containing protein